MGDGLPSFAPQWLKSSKALGAGASKDTSNSSSTAPKEEGSSAASWRAGSRLGLGAGTDRFRFGASADRDSKANGSQARRPAAGYQERERHEKGARAGFGNADRTPSGRDFRPASRPLSDRELVEQTTSLKLRPGSTRSGGKSALLDGGFPLASPKLGGGQGGFGATARPGPVRAGGLQQVVGPQSQAGGGQRLNGGPAVVQQRGVGEKDFPSLSRDGNTAGVTPRLVGPLPRQTATSEGQWTSRLAEVPARGEKPVTEASSSANAVAEMTSKPQPRMADAILQAQAAAAQETAAAQADKARLEQLALRQSKQLVPVVAGPKAKHSPTPPGPATSASMLTALKKPSGLETLGRPASLSSPTPLTRKDSLPEAARKVALSNGPAATQTAVTSREASRSPVPAASPKPAAALPSKPSRDRLDFFSSLRRKASGVELPGAELVRQISGAGSEGIAAIKEGESLSAAASESVEPATISNGAAAKAAETATALNLGETSSPSSPSTPKANGTAALSNELSTPTANGATFATGSGTPGANKGALAVESAAPSADAGANSVVAPSEACAPKANGVTAGCEEVIKTVFSAEEEAFLRSLGWEDCGDDSEGGLTEEEIAAFQAQVMAAAKRPRPASSNTGKGVLTAACVIPLKANGSVGFPAGCQDGRLADKNRLADPRLPHDYHSELEFSDSEEE